MCDAEAERLKDIHARMRIMMDRSPRAQAKRRLMESDSLALPETTITLPLAEYDTLVAAKKANPTITIPLDEYFDIGGTLPSDVPRRNAPQTSAPRRNAQPIMELWLESTFEHHDPQDAKGGCRRFDVIPIPAILPEMNDLIYIDGEKFRVKDYYIDADPENDDGWEVLVSEVVETPATIPCHGMIAGSFKSIAQTSVGFTEKEGSATFIVRTTAHDRPMPKRNSAILIDGRPYQVWYWGPGKGEVFVQCTAQTSRVEGRVMPVPLATMVEGQEDPAIVGRFTAETYGHDGHGGFMALIKISPFYTYDLKPEDTITLDGLLFEVEGVQSVPDEKLYWWIQCKAVFTPAPVPHPCPGIRRSAQVDIQIQPREWPDDMYQYLTSSQDTPWQSPGVDPFGLGS